MLSLILALGQIALSVALLALVAVMNRQRREMQAQTERMRRATRGMEVMLVRQRMNAGGERPRLEPEEAAAISRGVCPDCGGDELLAGPQGGSATNVRCHGCAAEFNVGPGGMGHRNPDCHDEERVALFRREYRA